MSRRGRFMVGGLVIVAAIAYLIWAGVSQSVVYFVTPSELLAAPVPSKTYRLGGLTCLSGDVMWGRVHYLGSNIFDLTIKDATQGWTYEVKITVSGAARSSAEWFASPVPYSDMADYGTVRFGSAYTGFTLTNYATIGGHSGSIGSFSNVQGDTMSRVKMNGWYYYCANENVSPLTDSGTSLTVTYQFFSCP